MYTSESLQLLRDRIDLVEVLSSNIDLKRTGASFKARCPFHEEKTPSFVVQRGDSHYHCYGCGAHGDAIAFMMSYLKLSFQDAVETLAERFGVTLEELGEDEKEKKGPNKSKLKDALIQAARFYHFYLLYSEEGKAALAYLYQRGIDLDFIRTFQVGFATKSPGLFLSYMRGKKVDEKTLQEVGLLSRSHRSKAKEFFSDRITFPIRDSFGHIVGFSARKIQEATFGPKYLNTPETYLFKKSKVLYGLSECRRKVAKIQKVILVEGQIDVLRLIHEGINWAVAGQGTAITTQQVNELVQLGVTSVYIAFDGDDAGKTAAVKAGDLFQKEGVEVFVCSLEEKKDPDTILMESGPESFLKLLEEADDYLTFLVSFYSKAMDLNSPSGKTQLADVIAKQVQRWDHPLMVHESLKKLARLLQVPKELIVSSETKETKPQIAKKSSTKTMFEVDHNKVLETDVLRWLLLASQMQSKYIPKALEALSEDHFVSPVSKKVFTIFKDQFNKEKPCDLLSLGVEIDDLEGQLFLSEMLQKKVNSERAKEGICESVQGLLERHWLHQREMIKIKIQSGHLSDEEVMNLAAEFDKIKSHPPHFSFDEETL